MIEIKISILSNINVNSLIKRLSKEHNVYKAPGYANWIGEILEEKSGLNEFSPKGIFVILDGHELLKPYELSYEEVKKTIDMYIGYIERYGNENSDINIFVSNIDIEQRQICSLKEARIEKIIEYYWYQALMDLVEKNSNIYIFDIKNLIEENGRNKFYSKKAWYLGGMKFSSVGEKIIIENLNRCIEAIEGKRKKCLVLDLDNTLWGGVVGEAGIEGIELSDVKEGARYKDFQKRIKEMENLGIILTIVSKNNYNDAIKVIKEHKDMTLKEDDFVLAKINWKTKVDNITQLAQELNIGLDSFVFIDDNPVERESVKSLIPEVYVPNFPVDSSNLEKHIIEVYNNHFLLLKATEEDQKKSEMYKSNIKRNLANKSSNDFNEFLKELETKVNIWKAEDEDIDRIVQLTQKTNQFNLTTIRYNRSQIKEFIYSDKYDVYVTSVEDKFGDNGKVGLIILEKKFNRVELNTFILSCRVMGRYIEDMIIDFIENVYIEKGYNEIITSYIPTERNKPVKTLFERLGYELMALKDNGWKEYRLILNKDKPIRNIYGELNKK